VITSKQIITLSEEWFKSITGYNSVSVPMYVNPDSTDIKELHKAFKTSDRLVRFIANAQSPQKVYVWDGTQAIHLQGLRALGLNNYSAAYSAPSLLMGYARIQSGKIVHEQNEKDPIEHISLCIRSLSSYVMWYPSDMVKTKQMFGKDISHNYVYATQFFKYDWSFADRYISGLGSYLNQEKTKFQSWVKEYASRLL
jgi:hypothetical protein